MAEILLFHHACGLTEGVRAFAERLTGHRVHTPDLFAGRTFASIDDGVGYAEQVGFGELMERGVAAADELPAELVYVGMSLGVLPAQRLAQTRRGATGAVLLEACVPASEFGDGWPRDVPVQIHGMESDPFFAGESDIDAARDIVSQIGGPSASLFLYPGDRHLFSDSSLPSYEPTAAGLVAERVAAFVNEVDRS